MSFNKILAKKVVGTALKDGVNVTLSVATKTSHWERPEFVVDTVGDVLKKSVASGRNAFQPIRKRFAPGKANIQAIPTLDPTSLLYASTRKAKALLGMSQCPKNRSLEMVSKPNSGSLHVLQERGREYCIWRK